MTIIILSFFISCTMVAVMLPKVLVMSLKKRLIDKIDHRKVHNVPASRLGGITFFPVILFSAWFCMAITNVVAPFVGTIAGCEIVPIDVKVIFEALALLLLFIIGVYDDIIGVSYRNKFIVQIFASILIVITGTYFKTLHGFCGIYEIPQYVGVPMTIGFMIFVTNSINLIDGIDGLASLLSIMALIVYTSLLFNAGLIKDALITTATLGALVPFCYSNVFGVRRGVHSKIFMGDAGALVIGAVLGFSAVTVWNMSLDPIEAGFANRLFFILAFTMLLVPCFDVIRVVIHRYLDHKPLFLPDKNHIHHKFMALGYTPREALLRIVAINFIFMILNIVLSRHLNFTFIVIIDVIVWTLMHIYISKRRDKTSN